MSTAQEGVPREIADRVQELCRLAGLPYSHGESGTGVYLRPSDDGPGAGCRFGWNPSLELQAALAKDLTAEPRSLVAFDLALVDGMEPLLTYLFEAGGLSVAEHPAGGELLITGVTGPSPLGH